MSLYGNICELVVVIVFPVSKCSAAFETLLISVNNPHPPLVQRHLDAIADHLSKTHLSSPAVLCFSLALVSRAVNDGMFQVCPGLNTW